MITQQDQIELLRQFNALQAKVLEAIAMMHDLSVTLALIQSEGAPIN